MSNTDSTKNIENILPYLALKIRTSRLVPWIGQNILTIPEQVFSLPVFVTVRCSSGAGILATSICDSSLYLNR